MGNGSPESADHREVELGGAADGREEEGFAPRIPSEISRPQWDG